MMIPLPPNTRGLVEGVLDGERQAVHPGLALDKYVESVQQNGEPPAKLSEHVQKPAVELLARLSTAPPLGFDYRQLLERRRRALSAVRAVAFRGHTLTPLTLHLARASALENAGLCLHHVYGFAYLPGTGLKGLARSYAETVWFPTRYKAAANGEPENEEEGKKAAEAWQKIEAVFGWSPNSDRGKRWKPQSVPGHSRDDGAHVGQVVFHDAWPAEWPRLKEDILNCHHRNYYDGKDAPGDWENPVPVYFLAVEAGQEFEFALSRRRPDVSDECLELARQWLVGSLTNFAAGAKTNSGYGTFALTAEEVALPESTLQAARETWKVAAETKRRVDRSFEVELITPAFLAGAVQYGRDAARDCDLRGATVRGLLRWWWRTLHVGFVDVPTLRALEAALWGDTVASGAIRVEVTRVGEPKAALFAYKDRYGPRPDFKQAHQLGDRPNQKTTQGLFYASYGMDENVKDRGQRIRRSRHYVEPGARWRIRLTARAAEFVPDRDKLGEKNAVVKLIAAERVFAEAEAALGLLCTYGGVGSKSRKGFGSLQLTEPHPAPDLDWCRNQAAELRQELGLGNVFREEWAESAAWSAPGARTADCANWARTIEVAIPSSDPWQVMDHVGYAYQAVAQQYAHNKTKMALGLPRKIHGPRPDPLKHQDPDKHQRPEDLGAYFPKKAPKPLAKDVRHASPVCIHVSRNGNGHVVRAVAFPAKYLPGLKASCQFLDHFLTAFEQELKKQLRPCFTDTGGGRGRRPGQPHGQRGPQPRSAAGGHTATQTPPAPSGPPLPRPGEMVEAELLEEKTKKGGWKARHLATGICGPIQNTGAVPEGKQPGEKLQLIVASAKPTVIAFRYPTEKELERLEKSQQSKGRPG